MRQSRPNAAVRVFDVFVCFVLSIWAVTQLSIQKSNLKEIVKLRHRISNVAGKCHITVNLVGIPKKELKGVTVAVLQIFVK